MAQTLKQQIRKVIRQHYNDELGWFRDDVNYATSTESFVASIAEVIKGTIKGTEDLSHKFARYSTMNSLDRRMGESIRIIRQNRGLTLAQVAEMIGVHPDFLDCYERGFIAGYADIPLTLFNDLKATEEERKLISDCFDNHLSLEEIIADVIAIYYGISFWRLRPELDFHDVVRPFAKSLAALANPA